MKRQRELEWEERGQRLDIWKEIVEWARRKRKNGGRAHMAEDEETVEWIFEQMIGRGANEAIEEEQVLEMVEQEANCLCQHRTSGTTLCCTRKRIFNEMVREVPKLKPVRARLNICIVWH